MYNKLCYVVATYSKKGGRLLLRSGKSKQKPASLSGFGDNGQAAFVHVHDLSGDTESDAGAGRLGGEERDEDTFLHIRRNACPVVADLYVRLSFRIDSGRQFYPRFPAILGGVEGIPYQVDQYLLDHRFVGNDL